MNRITYYIIILLLTSSLFALQGQPCRQKVDDALIFQKDRISLVISENIRLQYPSKDPSDKLLKYDPFLSLYLVETEKKFAYPFEFALKNSSSGNILNAKNKKEAKVVISQVGLNHFAQLTQHVKDPSLFVTHCCRVKALGGKKGFIQKEYIEHFIKSKKLFYGDIGIRVEDTKEGVQVVAVNPFVPQMFLIGDYIVQFEMKDVLSAADIMKQILFSKDGTKIHLRIKRGTKMQRVVATVYARKGGGYLSDTFLEDKGIYVNNDLMITFLTQKALMQGLKIGDRIVQVNQNRVTSSSQLRKELSKVKRSLSLLVLREEFEFFVKII